MVNNLLTRHPPAPPAAQVEPIAVRAPEAARLLGISERTLSEPAWADVPRIRRGNVVLYPLDPLRAWAAAQVAEQPPHLEKP